MNPILRADRPPASIWTQSSLLLRRMAPQQNQRALFLLVMWELYNSVFQEVPTSESVNLVVAIYGTEWCLTVTTDTKFQSVSEIRVQVQDQDSELVDLEPNNRRYLEVRLQGLY